MSMTITDAAEALLDLERIVAAVKGDEARESKFARGEVRHPLSLFFEKGIG
jgi:hypothetical protein